MDHPGRPVRAGPQPDPWPRSAGPRHFHPRRAQPAGIRRRAHGADRRALQSGDQHGQCRGCRGVRARHRRLPRRRDQDGGDRRRHRMAAQEAPGSGNLDDPDPHGRLRCRRHQLRHGRGEPRLLCDRPAGDDPCRLRYVDRRGGDHAGSRHRHARFDLQRLRHGDCIECGRRSLHGRAGSAGRSYSSPALRRGFFM